MRVLVVVGARPNFMKAAPIWSQLQRAGHEVVLVHTGQHYDVEMSDTFFSELELPRPDFHLGVGGGSHAVQTARIMEAFEPVLLETSPVWLVVVGDVNSTLACALVCAKLRAQIGCRLAHVEAGLRSRDWTMPEEVNRVLTDRMSDLLFTPSHDAHENLSAEGIPEGRIAFAGNVMIDSLLGHLEKARARGLARRLELPPGEFVVATIHRPANVDQRASLETILLALRQIATLRPVLLPLHPRTASSIQRYGFSSLLQDIRQTGPLGYLDMLSALDSSAAVLTDSGGVQEETTALGVPCVTLRQQTERPITLSSGTNRLAPWPLTPEGIISTTAVALRQGRYPVGSRCPEGWDGRAAERIVARLTQTAPPVGSSSRTATVAAGSVS